MLGSRSQRTFAGGILFLAVSTVLDVVHDWLNRRSPPFQGPVDDAMHVVFAVAPVAVVVAFGVICVWIVEAARHARRRPPVLLVVALLAGELLFSRLAPLHVAVSSAYHPLFPDYLAGPVVAVACAWTAGPLLDRRWLRWTAVLHTFLWSTGPVLCDILWHVEGGDRGTSFLWTTPGLGHVMEGLGTVFFAPVLLMWAARTLGQTGVLLPLLGGVAALLVALFFSLPRGRRACAAPLAISALWLLERVCDWGAFIAD
jgi:hypothetical protein